jgi:hypothetical protein
LITTILDSIQSKCISNLTTTNTISLDSSYPITSAPITTTTIFTPSTHLPTSTTPFSICTRSPFQIIPYSELNLQAIQDFKIAIITTLKVAPVKQSVTCACASKCQLTTTFKCVYFKSYPYVNNTNCYLYEFKSVTTKTLKNNLHRGIYYSQDFNIVSGIPKNFFS